MTDDDHSTSGSPIPAPDSPGGRGDSIVRERGRVEEIRLYKLALAQAWAIPAAMKQQVLNRLSEVLHDRKAGPRELTAAARAVISATGQNLAAVDTAIRARNAEELEARVNELEARLPQQGGKP
jgi:hypothetical protein